MTRRTLWPKVPAAFVDRNLTGHKILGLAVTALLYLICLTGTVTVFYQDIQYWETPGLPSVAVLKPQGVAAAIADARAHMTQKDGGIYVFTPTADFHRLTVQAGTTTRGYDGDGRYAGPARHPVTDAVTELHYDLHLPSTVGFILVGLGGVAMVALIVGGLLAHPRIFKDAFLWRVDAAPRLHRADLHNRIGVWAAPFHIVIAVTGAVIGLLQVMILIVALTAYNGNTTAAGAPLFGAAPPRVQAGTQAGEMSAAAIATALATVQRDFPGAMPNYMSLDGIGTGHEALSIDAEIRGRLVYGDDFHFDSTGRLLGVNHMSRGALGKQVYASLYKLHFGSFGGVWVRWAYTLLGAGLCLICTTGMDIWLLKAAQKGRGHPRLHKVWTAFVWGAPAALAIAAVATLTVSAPYAPVFWGLTAVFALAGLVADAQTVVARLGRLGLAASLLVLVGVHIVRFGAPAVTTGLGVNLSLTGLAVVLALLPAAVAALRLSSRR